MKSILMSFCILIINFGCKTVSNKQTIAEAKVEKVSPTPTATMKPKTIHEYKVPDINGKEFDFSSLKGKKIMIVNTASECGLTPQYENLEKLNKEYGGDKFVIVGFPCNDFGAQEPGSADDIKAFCSKNYGVTFLMMGKISVVGESKCEIYKWLTKVENNGVESTEVKWNFQKYLINEDGTYYKKIAPQTLPDDPEIVKWIKG